MMTKTKNSYSRKFIEILCTNCAEDFFVLPQMDRIATNARIKILILTLSQWSIIARRNIN